jgi:3-phenylpropionate/trans-cinnamate dioxygenase ferredoxin subunit
MAEEQQEYDWHKVMMAGRQGANFVMEGKIRPFMLDDEALCMAKLKGQLYAFAERCPHQGAHLKTGLLTAECEVECPWHRFKFSLVTGKNTSGGGQYLDVYPVQVRPDGLWIGKPKRRKWFGIF